MTTPTDEIATERFFLRILTENDVNERYLSWLRNPEAIKYIAAATQTHRLSELKHYVLDKISREDVRFFGIFEKATSKHIGNIKYDPVNSKLGYAVMGILIGDPSYRGKGVTAEVLNVSAYWMKHHHNIRQIILGVSNENIPAIRAYEKSGFVISKTPHIQAATGAISMVWELK